MNLAELERYVRARCRTTEDGCLIWTRGMNSHGVPCFRLRDVGTFNARRAMWLASGRPIRKGYVFCRPECDPRCVNPEHLIYASKTASMRMAARRGLLSAGIGHSALVAAGVRSNRRTLILDEAAAHAMRERYAETGNAALVAREFGVSHSHAHRVVTNRRWVDFSNPFWQLMKAGAKC